MTKWRWNYFTLESTFKVKCNLCNKVFKICVKHHDALYDHLWMINDPDHSEAFDRIDAIKEVDENLRDVDWDSYFYGINEEGSTNMFSEKVKCKHCHGILPRKNDRRLKIGVSKDIVLHLRKTHEVDKDNWRKFKNWIQDKAAAYCDEDLFQETIKIEKCKKCNVQIRGNPIIFVKHLIKKHSKEFDKFPLDIIPTELYSLISNKDEDIAKEDKDEDIAEEISPSVEGSVKCKDIQKPSFDSIDTPSTNQRQSSSKRKKDSSTSTEKGPSKKKTSENNSNNK